MVDHRFDHIDNGNRSPAGPRAYLRVPSVTWTQLPNVPPMAHSRTDVAAPVSSGTSDRPWVGCATVASNASAMVAKRSTLVVSASHVPPPVTPGHATNSGM